MSVASADALITEAKAAFRGDFRYLEEVLKCAHRYGLTAKSPKSAPTADRPAQAVHAPNSQVDAVTFMDSLSPHLANYVRITGDCWVWCGSLTGSGQPVIRLGPQHKVTQVRRHLYETRHGPIAKGRRARSRNTCATHCVHPDHVLVKTGS